MIFLVFAFGGGVVQGATEREFSTIIVNYQFICGTSGTPSPTSYFGIREKFYISEICDTLSVSFADSSLGEGANIVKKIPQEFSTSIFKIKIF